MKLILQAIKALFRKVENAISQSVAKLQKQIDSVKATATTAKTMASKAQTAAEDIGNTKMSFTNPAGEGSFSMGRKSGTQIGENSHAEGENVTASGKYSHAEGKYSEATAECSHAECYFTRATGLESHAEGNATKARGRATHSEGWNSEANGDVSHAEGYHTIANGEYQHTQGRCNIIDDEGKYLHIVGNGKTHNARSNAHTLDWDGNAWFAGSVEGKAVILPSTTDGSTKRFKITVDDSGTLTATEIT